MEFALKPFSLRANLLACAVFALSSNIASSQAAEPLDGIVAVVDNSMVLASEVDTALAETKTQLAARKQTVPPEDFLRNEVTKQLILRKIQLEMIKNGGLTVDNDTLNNAMAEMAQKQGAPSLSAFQKAVDAQRAGGYAALRERLREDLSITRLRQQRVNSRVQITERDIDNFLASPESQEVLATEYRVAHVMVKLPANASINDQARAAEIAQTIDNDLKTGMPVEQVIRKNDSERFVVGGADMGWRKPEELPPVFADNIASLSAGETTGVLPNAEGVHIIQLLDRRGAENVKVHQWQVRHILIAPNDVISLEDAQNRIETLYQRLQKGAAFDELAKTYSNDPGSARKGGSLDWVSLGEMVPAFESVMRKTPIGDFSTPFQSPFGWHILKVDGERDQDVSEQYKRGIARQTLFSRQYDQELDNWLREIRANAYVNLRNTPAS